MHQLTRHEVLAVSGGDDTVDGIFITIDSDCALPPLVYAYDPLPPFRRGPQIGPGHPFP